MPSQVVTLTVEIADLEAVPQEAIPGILDALDDFAPVLQDVETMLSMDQQLNFDDEGEFYGAEWIPNGERYAQWKEKHFGSTSTLVLTGKLRAEAGATVMQDPFSVTVGFNLGVVPYAEDVEQDSDAPWTVSSPNGRDEFRGRGHPGRILVSLADDEIDVAMSRLSGYLADAGLPSDLIRITPDIVSGDGTLGL